MARIGYPTEESWQLLYEAEGCSPWEYLVTSLVSDVIALVNSPDWKLMSILAEAGQVKRPSFTHPHLFRQIEQVLECATFFDEHNGPTAFLVGRAHMCLGSVFKSRSFFARTLSSFVTDESGDLLSLAGVTQDGAGFAVYLAKVMRLFEGLIPPRVFSLAEVHKPVQFQQV